MGLEVEVSGEGRSGGGPHPPGVFGKFVRGKDLREGVCKIVVNTGLRSAKQEAKEAEETEEVKERKSSVEFALIACWPTWLVGEPKKKIAAQNGAAGSCCSIVPE